MDSKFAVGAWYQPDWIYEERATQSRMKMQAANIIYAGIFII